MSKYLFIQKALAARETAGQLRSLKNVEPGPGAISKVDGQSLINFSSNDYLGLSRHPKLAERSIDYIRKYGVGSTASRLVCGNYKFLPSVEKKLARLKGQNAALLFNSGFVANVSILAALADRHSLIIADRLCHNSIMQGAILSRAKLIRFNHNDTKHLRCILAETSCPSNRIIIVTESVFSMDGDLGKLAEISSISQQHNALFYVDEAHATGVLGKRGMGLACAGEADVVMGTFGKGCGSFGAYATCTDEMKQYLVNFSSGLIYSTALPPGAIGAIDAALDLVPDMVTERHYLQELANYLRTELQILGFDTGQSSTQIVPVYIGAGDETKRLAIWLQKKGVLGTAILPPTVEAGRARIRLALSILHTRAHIDTLLDAFSTWSR